MGPIEQLKQLVARLGAPVIPSTHSFLQLDVPRISTELQLRERGERRGRQDLPAVDSAALDETEQAILLRIDGSLQEAYEQFRNHLNTYNTRLQSIGGADQAADFRMVAEKAVSSFQAEIQAIRNQLFRQARAAKQAEEDFLAFRKANGISRGAHYPKSKVQHLFFLLLLAALETIPNAVFLKNDAGYLGGWTTAVAFTVGTVLLSWAAGVFGLRSCNHRAVIRKVLGAALFVVLVVFVIVAAFALAHFRAATAHFAGEQAWLQAGLSLRTDFFGIADLRGWLMVLLTLVWSVAALIGGYKMYDPYPSYEQVDRRRESTQSLYIDTATANIDQLKEDLDEFSEALSAARSQLHDRTRMLPVILEHRRRLVDLFDAHLDHLENAGRTLLAVYQESNRAARKGPPPKRFSEPWTLARPRLPELDDDQWRMAPAQLEAAAAAVDDALKRLHASFNDAVTTVKSIDDLLGSVS